MEEYFNSIMLHLEKMFSIDDLNKIMRTIRKCSLGYEITKKSTEIVAYEPLPECFKAFIVSRKIEGMSDGSLKLYSKYITDFLKFVNKPVENVTTSDIRVWLYESKKERNISNRTLNSRRSIISSFFEWLACEGYVTKNPVRAIKAIKYSAEPRKPLSGIELELVRNAASTKREKAVIEFLYSTGCRVTELIRVKKSDIDFETHEVVLFGKGGKYRKSFINARCEVALKEYFHSREDLSEYVFVSDKRPCSPVTNRTIERDVEEIGIRSGIGRKLFPHLIRHTMATDGLARGIDVTEIQKTLGHSNINTTLIYSHVDENKVKSDHLRLIV